MKIFFVDVDGTILDSTRGMYEVTDKTRYAIKALKDKGYYVFISSGRAKCMMDKNILSLNPSGFVLTNGAYAELNGEKLFSVKIPDDDIKAIKDYFVSHDGLYFFENQDFIEVNKKDGYFDEFIGGWGLDKEIFCIDKIADEPCLAMTAFLTEKECDEFYNSLKDRIDIRKQRGFNSFDVSPIGMHKGYGVKRTLEMLKISSDDAYAFGDGINDLEMLESVKYSFCMANGDERCKKIAYETVDDVLTDGFYETLVKYNLIDPKV